MNWYMTNELYPGGPLITWDMSPSPRQISEAPHTHVWFNDEFGFTECRGCGVVHV